MGNEEQQTQKQGGAQQDASAEAQQPNLTDVFVFLPNQPSSFQNALAALLLVKITSQ